MAKQSNIQTDLIGATVAVTLGNSIREAEAARERFSGTASGLVAYIGSRGTVRAAWVANGAAMLSVQLCDGRLIDVPAADVTVADLPPVFGNSNAVLGKLYADVADAYDWTNCTPIVECTTDRRLQIVGFTSDDPDADGVIHLGDSRYIVADVDRSDDTLLHVGEADARMVALEVGYAATLGLLAERGAFTHEVDIIGKPYADVADAYDWRDVWPVVEYDADTLVVVGLLDGRNYRTDDHVLADVSNDGKLVRVCGEAASDVAVTREYADKLERL